MHAQDHEFRHCGNHSHRNSEYRLEVLDRLDRIQCGLPPDSVIFLSKFFYPNFSILRQVCDYTDTPYQLANCSCAANRTLEDMDAYYRSNPSLIVTGDPDAISQKRPQKYIDHEKEQITRTITGKDVLSVSGAEQVEWTANPESKN